MGRNIAQISRLEVEAHRQFALGITASDPEFKEVDGAGNKGWVIDVYTGPVIDDEAGTEDGILSDVPIASVARAVVGQKNIPVLLERSRQTGWTVVGRSETARAGYVLGTVTEDNYHRRLYNYRALKLLHLPDLDFTVETFGAATARWKAGDTTEMQIVRATDAFGHQVMGPEVTNPPQKTQDKLSAVPLTTGKSRHLVARAERFGEAVTRWNSGDTSAMQTGIRTLTEAVL